MSDVWRQVQELENNNAHVLVPFAQDMADYFAWVMEEDAKEKEEQGKPLGYARRPGHIGLRLENASGDVVTIRPGWRSGDPSGEVLTQRLDVEFLVGGNSRALWLRWLYQGVWQHQHEHGHEQGQPGNGAENGAPPHDFAVGNFQGAWETCRQVLPLS